MSSSSEDHFVVPLKYYVGTLIALLILTFITVWVAQFDLGRITIYLAMFVAMIKAAFVVFFFMGVKWEESFNKVVFFGSLVFVGIFLTIVLFDVLTRTGIYSNEADYIHIDSPVKLIDSHSKTHP